MIPKKLFYKIGEVCEITDTQPYVLRFWESEFPQLAPRKNRSGQRVYQRKDIDTVLRIKKLLYEEEYTIAGARKKLDEEPQTARQDAGDLAAAIDVPDDSPEEAAPPRAAHPEQEADHPVDALADRMSRLAGRRAEAAHPDSEREARLEKALGELKKSLKEMLPGLRKDL